MSEQSFDGYKSAARLEISKKEGKVIEAIEAVTEIMDDTFQIKINLDEKDYSNKIKVPINVCCSGSAVPSFETNLNLSPNNTSCDVKRKSKIGKHGHTRKPKNPKRVVRRKKNNERKKKEHEEIIKDLTDKQLKEMEEEYDKIKLSNPGIIKYLTPEDLEEDSDPEKLNKIIKLLSKKDDNDDYTVDNEKPVFSDDNVNKTKEKKIKEKKVSEVDSDKPKSKKRKSSYFINVEIDEEEKEPKKKKSEIFNPSEHGTFKEFIKNYKPVINDNIIKDYANGHIICKFKYRRVTPVDFGMTVEEIMFSDKKEPNRDNSLKKVISIRSQEQEKKDVEDCLEEDEDDTRKKSKSAKKRLRKALKTQKLRNTISQTEDNDSGTIMNDEVETDNNKISLSECKEGDVENNTVEKSSKIKNKDETDKISKKKKTKSKKSSLPDIKSRKRILNAFEERD